MSSSFGIKLHMFCPTCKGHFILFHMQLSLKILKYIFLLRFAEEKDVVHTILYLLSDKAEMVHGVTLPVDGGFLIN